MAETRQCFEQRLRQRFAEFISRRNANVQPVLGALDKLRVRGWTAFVFGGIPRGVFDRGRRYQPRDLDLVFDDEHFASFESAFEHCVQRRNSYGGLRLVIENAAVDAWPVSATWAFREGHVKDPSFERLPLTTFLNVDAVVVEAVSQRGKKRRLYEAGFFQGWRDRTLDINLRQNPYPAICVARTLRISRTYGFKISHRLCMYLWHLLATYPPAEFEAAQFRHYGEVDFRTEELVSMRSRLEQHLVSSALFSFALFPTEPEQINFRLSTGRWSETMSFAYPVVPSLAPPQMDATGCMATSSQIRRR